MLSECSHNSAFVLPTIPVCVYVHTICEGSDSTGYCVCVCVRACVCVYMITLFYVSDTTYTHANRTGWHTSTYSSLI